MTKEEAISKGIAVQETVHSMKRRSPWHDYHERGTYMLTLVVEGRKPLLGRLVGDTPDNAHIELSELGKAIKTEEIRKISHFYPMVDVWKLCIMPDHLHMILRVKEDMDKSKHLGQIVRGFKTGCSRAWWRICDSACGSGPASSASSLGKSQRNSEGAAAAVPGASPAAVPVASPVAVPVASPVSVPVVSPVAVPVVSPTGAGAAAAPPASPSPLRPVLFERGYNDKLLFKPEQLATWKHYLDDNPRRLMMKRANPHLFTVLHDMQIAGRRCQIVGNRFLLDIPDKMAVIVHRRYSDEENARLREEWLACGERGGVLVSAAIAVKEKEVMREAMNRGYNIILLRENGFPPLYKPSGESFDACSQGRLLQICPWEYHMQQKTITRSQCLELNEMAEGICNHISIKDFKINK